MQCDTCHRQPSSRLPFNCTLCARDALYQPRVQLAQALLQKDEIGKEVEQNVADVAKSSKDYNAKSIKRSEPKPNPSWTVQSAAAERALSDDRTASSLDHVQILRDEIRKTRDDISERKARFQRRRSEFASAKQELSRKQNSGTEPVDKGIRRTEHRWGLMHKKTAESRLYLCREAALLYGLQQRKRKKGGLGRDVYFIGGVPIADLRDLNSMQPFDTRWLLC